MDSRDSRRSGPAGRARAARLPRSATAVVDRAVLAALTATEGATRADLVQRTGLSRGAVAAATDRLLADGRVTVAGTVPTPERGRPARSYRLVEKATPLVLVTLRRDRRTDVVLVDGSTASTAAGGVGDWTRDGWDAWAESVEREVAPWALDRAATDVVVSVPAPWDDTRGPVRARDVPRALQAKIRAKGGVDLPAWLDAGLPDRLAQRLGTRVRVVNDANLAGLGEFTDGAGRGSRVGLHLTARDGLGACVAVDGSVVVGACGLAGEVAHVQLDVDGDLCVCGNRGCLATNMAAITTVGAVSALHGVTLTAAEVDSLVDQADPVTLQYFGELARTAAAALAGAVSVLNPDVLVVDATLGPAVDAVVSGLRDELVRRCPPAILQSLRIVPGTLPDPPVAGARALVRADPTF